MRKIGLIAIFLTFGMLLSCATTPPIPTKSGLPEITICGIGKNELMEKFVAGMSMGGATIRSSNNFQIVVGQPVTNPMLAALYGSRYNSTPELRYIFTFADTGNCTYIGARVQIVTNPGSGFEQVNDFSRGKDAYNVQHELEQLKSAAEGR